MEHKKLNTIDLFAGCGGLMDGFEQSGCYKTIACVEWEKAPIDNLRKRLKDKWQYKNADKIAIRFDIQRTDELINGWDDLNFGVRLGLKNIVGKSMVDLIIGGPPCQAYSIAGRIRDKNGMKDDYRNYLFESYIKIVREFKPKAIIFENVQGMLSASPDGNPIIDRIRKGFLDEGYDLLERFDDAVFDVSEFDVPQKRKRVILFAVNKDVFKERSSKVISEFYSAMKQKRSKKLKTVSNAIGDLPKLFPCEAYKFEGRRYSHTKHNSKIMNHFPRFHSERDIAIFKLLAEDIESGRNIYSSVESLKKLYFEQTGKNTNVHKYHVLRKDQPSNTIPAHLYKDGLRHIHPDSTQGRSITVREAARLQTFPDDYEFIGSMMDQYKMIGNAVPPLFAKVIAETVHEVIRKYEV